MVEAFSVTQEGYTMRAQVEVIGKDLLITVTGGDSPHIGTVTTMTEGKTQVVRFPSHDGRFHKDDVLADQILKVIQNSLPGNCVITSGVHIDGIISEQIKASGQMATQLGEKLLAWMEKTDFSIQEPVYKNFSPSNQR